MAGPYRGTRNLTPGWMAFAVLGVAVCVHVWREIHGLAQAPERILVFLALAAMAALFMHLKQSRSQMLADAQAANRLGELIRELKRTQRDWRGGMTDESGSKWGQEHQQDRILKAIDEIALLTNMAAVNAALEASRAPESQRGFTVVADEVRDLAGRSAEASRDLTDLFGRHQSETARSEAAAARLAATIDRVKSLLVEIR